MIEPLLLSIQDHVETRVQLQSIADDKGIKHLALSSVEELKKPEIQKQLHDKDVIAVVNGYISPDDDSDPTTVFAFLDSLIKKEIEPRSLRLAINSQSFSEHKTLEKYYDLLPSLNIELTKNPDLKFEKQQDENTFSIHNLPKFNYQEYLARVPEAVRHGIEEIKDDVLGFGIRRFVSKACNSLYSTAQ